MKNIGTRCFILMMAVAFSAGCMGLHNIKVTTNKVIFEKEACKTEIYTKENNSLRLSPYSVKEDDIEPWFKYIIEYEETSSDTDRYDVPIVSCRGKWLKVTLMEDRTGVIINVTENDTGRERTGQISIGDYGDGQATIEIRQKGV